MKNFVNLGIIVFVLVMAIMSTAALAIEPAVIRVSSADPASKTYTFTCQDSGSGLAGNGVRNWFIYPEDTNVNELVTSLPANQPLTHTFSRNAYYDITCNVPNPPGLNYTSLYRHSMHIDLRTQLGNPAVVPISAGPGTVTEKCVYNSTTSYTISWFLSSYSLTGGSGPTVRYPLNVTGDTITFTPPFTPGLFDTHCLVHLTHTGTDIDVPNGIDFASTANSAPYIADQYGIDAAGNFAAFNPSAWLSQHNGTGTVTPPTNQTGSISLTTAPGGASVNINGVFVGLTAANGVLAIPNVATGSDLIIISLAGYTSYVNTVTITAGQTASLNVVLQAIPGGSTTYTSMNTIPATCTGGTIGSDAMNGGGGRVITCTSGANSLTTTVYNKPGDTSPTYFEMYKTSNTGSGVQICLGTTCISNNGFAISPNFPISSGSPPPTTGTIVLTTTPGGAAVAMNGNSIGTSSAGTSGTLSITNAPAGTDTLVVSAAGFISSTKAISVTAGQTATLSVVLQPNAGGSAYTSVQNVPASCNGGTITSDTFSGGRSISCANGANSLTIAAWDKPSNTAPQWFEMYKQSQAGAGLQICLLTTCISSNGFAKSPTFPITG